MDKMTIGVLVGSARRDSYCQKIAQVITSHMPESFDMVTLDLSVLPLFNQDYDDDGTTPPEWISFRETIKSCAGFLFVTPEYNRSYTPLLKNALDIASRPMGKNQWGGKPGAIVGVSPGAMGAFGAVQHLRQTVGFLDVYLLGQPEVYLSGVAGLMDEGGNITNEKTLGFLKIFASSYSSWIERFAGR